MFLLNIINAENHFCFLGYFFFYKVKLTEFIQNKHFCYIINASFLSLFYF